MISIKNGAAVEPDALKKMSNDISALREDLSKTSNNLYRRTENLNQKFQDGNFKNLYTVIIQFKENTEKLNTIFSEFVTYLNKQEKTIREYTSKNTMKSTVTNIN